MSRRRAAWSYMVLVQLSWLPLVLYIATDNSWFVVVVVALMTVGVVGIFDAGRGEPYERYRIGRR